MTECSPDAVIHLQDLIDRESHYGAQRTVSAPCKITTKAYGIAGASDQCEASFVSSCVYAAPALSAVKSNGRDAGARGTSSWPESVVKLDASDVLRPDREGVGRIGATEIVVCRAFDVESNAVLSCKVDAGSNVLRTGGVEHIRWEAFSAAR